MGVNDVPLPAKELANPIITPADIVQRILSARPQWYQWVAVSAAPDVLIALETRAQEKGEGWHLSLTSKFPVPKTRAFPVLEAVEPFLSTDLLRLYIITNLSSLQERGIQVKATLREKGAPVYRVGDTLSFTIEVPVDGYLYLVNVNPEGALCLLFPQPGESNYIQAGNSIELPRKGSMFTVKEPVGEEFVKAIFTKIPIDLCVLNGNTAAPQDIIMRVPHTPDVGTADIYFKTEK